MSNMQIKKPKKIPTTSKKLKKGKELTLKFPKPDIKEDIKEEEIKLEKAHKLDFFSLKIN